MSFRSDNPHNPGHHCDAASILLMWACSCCRFTALGASDQQRPKKKGEKKKTKKHTSGLGHRGRHVKREGMQQSGQVDAAPSRNRSGVPGEPCCVWPARLPNSHLHSSPILWFSHASRWLASAQRTYISLSDRGTDPNFISTLHAWMGRVRRRTGAIERREPGLCCFSRWRKK